MKHSVRITAFLSALALLLPLLPISAEPEEPETEPLPPQTTVLENADADLVDSLTDTPVDLFTQPAVDWTPSSDSVSLTAEKQLPFSPRRVFGGKYSLLLRTDSYRSAQGIGIRRTFGEAEGAERLDASRSSSFTFSACLPEKAGVSYVASVRIVSYMISTTVSTEPITYETSVTLEGGSWQTVLCDLTQFEGKSDIRSVSLTFSDPSAADGSTVSAAVDSIGFLSASDPVSAIRFLSDSYLPVGCTLQYGSELSVTLTAAEGTLSLPPVQTDPWLIPEEDTALCVKLRGISGLRSLSLTATPADPAASPVTSACELSGSGSIQYCYFPLGTDPVASLSLTFSGSVRGEAQILSVAPISFPTRSRTSLGSITSCLLSQSGQTFDAEGQITDDALRRYAGGTLVLYSLSLTESEDSLSSLRPIAQTDLTREFRFSCRIEELPYSVLTRKFIAAILWKGTVYPVTSSFCISNPEVTAKYDAVPIGTASKKGACPIEEYDDLDNLSDTVIPVPLETLFSSGTEGFAHRTDRVTYYFNEQTLKRLDSIGRICRIRGIRALIALTVTSSEGVAAAQSLAAPGGVPRSEDPSVSRYAFNTSSESGLRSLRAAADLLASRYLSDPDPIGGYVGFIVGENVNETYENYHMGMTALSPLVRGYAAALRTVWASAKAVNSEAKIYVSLSSRFGGTETRAPSERFGARVFLDALDEVISSQGDFLWQPAFDPYPSEEYLAYADHTAGTDPEAEYVSAANLDVLTSYISRRQFYFLGQYRPITLYEPEKARTLKGGNHEIRQSADFVFTFFKISTKNYSLIEAIVPGNGHPLNYGGSLKALDSDLTGEGVTYALEVIGSSSWEELITGFDLSRAATQNVTEAKPLSFIPSSIKGELSLCSFEKRGSSSGFESYLGTTELTGGTTVGAFSYLSIQSSPGTGWFGTAHRFPASVDLSVSPYMALTFIPTSLPQETEELECRILLSSANDVFSSDVILRAGEPNTVILDLHSFRGLRSLDTIRVLFRGRNGSDPGDPTVLLGAIRVMSEEYRDSDLKDAFDRAQNNRDDRPDEERRPIDTRIVLLLISVMVVASTALALRLLNANRTEDGKEREQK